MAEHDNGADNLSISLPRSVVEQVKKALQRELLRSNGCICAQLLIQYVPCRHCQTRNALAALNKAIEKRITSAITNC